MIDAIYLEAVHHCFEVPGNTACIPHAPAHRHLLDCRRLQRGHCRCLPLPNINAPPVISIRHPSTSARATFDLADSIILPNVGREIPIFFAASS